MYPATQHVLSIECFMNEFGGSVTTNVKSVVSLIRFINCYFLIHVVMPFIGSCTDTMEGKSMNAEQIYKQLIMFDNNLFQACRRNKNINLRKIRYRRKDNYFYRTIFSVDKLLR